MKLRTLATSLVLAATIATPAFAEKPLEAQQRRVSIDKTQKPAKKAGPRMDVVFAIDATSSMSDEIDVIKQEVWAIANKIASGNPTPDLRLGLVLYRDTTDARLVEVTPLTRDIDAIHDKLMAAQAVGGGDKPEHVGKGLHASLDLDWDSDQGVSRTIYVVGDAGANNHADFTVATALLRAKEMGVKINAIGCSGLTNSERGEFTALASGTGGTFEALTYYAVVEGDDGRKKSVVYYDGDAYEMDGELAADEWKSGGKKLIEKKKMKRASSSTRSRAAAAPKANNLDSVVREDMLDMAEEAGVAY